jgi:beta-lactamase class A
MLNFFEMLALGQAVSPGASSEMLHLLARQRVNDRIPRLLPAGTIVAHKTGNLPGVVNDVGIVYGADLTYIVVVLVDRTRDEGEATRIAADVALAAYEHFQGTRARAPGLAGTTQFPAAEPTPTRRPRPPTALPTATPAPTATDVEVPTTATPTNTATALAPSPTSTVPAAENSPTRAEPTPLPTVLPNQAAPVRAWFTPVPPRVPTQTPTVSPPTSTPAP